MNKRRNPFTSRALRSDALMLLTAAIWGFAFVAQRSGMEYMGPFSFNGIRFLLGSLSLVPVVLIRRRGHKKIERKGPAQKNNFILYSLAAGTCLFLAATLQQVGIMFTTAGNSGFITGLYVVLTPIFGIFLGRKTGIPTWIGAVLTLTGLYFLSAAGHGDASHPWGSINPGDIITAIGAIFWAFHILVIDQLAPRIDPIVLSAGQFLWCGLFSLIIALVIEPSMSGLAAHIDPGLIASGTFSWQSLPDLIAGLAAGKDSILLSADALIPILYSGFGSVGIAYTLQVVAQKDAPPAHATIILSLEGCFAAIGGVIILSEPLGPWTLLGFILMFSGMLATQWDVIRKPE
ncbi:transporter [Spirochaetia bacterium]|nr:transporter [Spirochaetia bacterium]